MATAKAQAVGRPRKLSQEAFRAQQPGVLDVVVAVVPHDVRAEGLVVDQQRGGGDEHENGAERVTASVRLLRRRRVHGC